MFRPTLTALLTAGTLLLSALPVASHAADLDAIRKSAQQKLSRSAEDGNSVTITSVRPAPITGLFELVTEDRALYYTDEAVNYIIVNGSIIDMKAMKNLTADRMREITAIRFDTLPLELAIKNVKGNGKRKVAVFSDSDCPFCKKLETELAGVTDVTIYTFIYPIAQLHPNAPEHSRRIWCASDRLKAWSDYWNKSALPEPRECDASGLEKIQKLGRTHGIQATPSLVFADGHMVPGAIPTAELEHNLGPR